MSKLIKKTVVEELPLSKDRSSVGFFHYKPTDTSSKELKRLYVLSIIDTIIDFFKDLFRRK